MMQNKNFKICTFNCNGLGSYSKRKDVFQFLRKKNFNIIFLQETHMLSKDENYIRSLWGFDVITSGNATNKNGVAVLFSNNFEYKLHKVIKDIEGCYIILDIEFLKRRYTLVNIYGPSAGDDPDFFVKVWDFVKDIGNQYTIAAGDWNCVQDMKTDARNYSSVSTRPRTRKQITEIMVDNELVDIWRELHPEKRNYTWRKFNTIKQGRLDYFLVSEDCMLDVQDCKIEAGHRSDHSLVTLMLKTDSFQRDRPFWKFNNSLLRDIDFVNLIKKHISEIKQQYAVPIYNFDNFGQMNNEEIEFTISDQLFLEILLCEIRGKTIAYASFKKRETNSREIALQKQLTEEEQNIELNNLNKIEEIKKELEEIRKKQAEGAAIRSRSRWILEGEKPSAYFCNLEKRNYLDKSMNYLQKDSGETLTEQKDILNEVKQFYESLYSERETQHVDLNTLFPENTKKLIDP